jgi:hypothetical protein
VSSSGLTMQRDDGRQSQLAKHPKPCRARRWPPCTTESRATRSTWRAVLSSRGWARVDREGHWRHAPLRREGSACDRTGQATYPSLSESVRHPVTQWATAKSPAAFAAGPSKILIADSVARFARDYLHPLLATNLSLFPPRCTVPRSSPVDGSMRAVTNARAIMRWTSPVLG